jgi:type IV pilus assembly protein PilC
MAEFICKIGTVTGKVLLQTEHAASEAEVRHRLRSEGFYVFSVRPKELLGTRWTPRRSGRIKADDFLLFNQQFLTLSKSGLPLQKSLELLAGQAQSEALRTAVTKVQEKVRAGALLSEAFESVGRFPKMYCATLRAGERSGSLDRVLAHYLAYQKTSRSFRKKFLSALIYPAFLMVFLVGLISFVITFVVPRFANLYAELEVQLPPLTLLVISFSLGVRRYVALLLAGIVLAVVGTRWVLRSRRVRLAWERAKFGMPVAGKLLLKFSVAEFARTLSTLLQGGIPIVSALETAKEAVTSPLMAEAIAEAEKEVTAGRALSASLRPCGLFPPLALDMIEVGESTGAMSNMLEALAEFFEEDVSVDLATLVALVDPIMIAGMAVVVATVLVAFYLPLFSMAAQIH